MNAEAETMNEGTKATPQITRAAERYLEQYGDPLVMNTYLKVTILVLAAVCFALAALTFKSQTALANMHPMIVRINDVGHAEAIDYRNFQYRPQEAENKYYLTRWADLYFSRNRFTIERDQTQSLYFLNSDVQRAVIDQERKDNSIQNYVKDSTLPYVDVEIKSVILDDLRQSPYSARIEFEKVYTNPADHSELKRERWTASVTYVFRENVKNNELAVNPLGLTIVRFRAEAYECRFLLPIRLAFPTCPRALSSGPSRTFRRAMMVANYVLLPADKPARIGLQLRWASVPPFAALIAVMDVDSQFTLRIEHELHTSGTSGECMTLQPGSFAASDATGSNETITLQPVSPATSTGASIASAFYGNDASGHPKPATVAADQKSLTITVASGINSLVITLVSPNPDDETVQLCQGSTVLATPTVRNHSGVSTIFIKGT
jgi:type IV secretion system protein VirB5